MKKAVVRFYCFAILVLVLLSAMERIRPQLPGGFQCKEKLFHCLVSENLLFLKLQTSYHFIRCIFLLNIMDFGG